MNPVKKKIRANKVVSRFLPITKSVLEGLEPEPKITDFTLIKELGEGSFSRVLLVQHNITQAQYAIKAIDKRNKDNVEEKDYFKREAEIMYRINHPNVVKLYGMTASILKDVISATYYLHHMYPPIIHRDIKPENVLINSEMKAKLTDFGWSNYLNKSDMKRTTMCGTPIYLAPELVNNYGHDHRVDIWCIGVLMFELLTGQPPWIGEDVQTLKYNISNMKIRWPKNMDPDAVDLLKKTLRYNPDERISLRNMLMHPFFTKYYPDAVNSLIKPDGKKQRIYVISKDNPNIYYTSSINNFYDNYNSISNSNNNIIYPTIINEIPYTPPANITTTSYPTPSLTLSTSYYDTSNNNNYNYNNNYNSIINTVPNISSISLNDYGYTDKTYNSLNIKEFVENQERIDELVRKTEKNDSRNKIIFQSSYPTYNYNITNSRPILHHSSSVYKTQSPFYFSNNNSIYQVNKNIKYSLPITKYSVQPVKYKKPKIIYSSLTAKRSFEGDIYGKRQLNNLYNKYGMNFK